ncbi:MAG: alpha/beta fold hydrolase [Clostridia bacterium]|nr:alpha/beta fold hydrolase [Clostridia bacterium]
MKKLFIILLILTLGLTTITACKSKEAVVDPDVEPEMAEQVLDEEAAKVIGKAFLEQFLTGDFESAYNGHALDEAMKKAFPVEMMASIHEQLITDYGAFIELSGQKETTTQGFYIITFGASHEKQTLAYNVVFNQKGEIGGFNYQEIESLDVFSSTEKPVHNGKAVTFGSEDFPLEGTLLYPEGEGPFPAVVLVHGSGPNDRDETIMGNKPFRDIAEGLAAQGIAVLRYDKRTYTHSLRYSDPLVAADVTIYNEVIDDARYAVEFLSQQSHIDTDKLFVIGHSLGANQAPRIAEGRTDITGIAMLGGNVTPLQDLMVYQYEYLFSLDETADELTKAAQNTQLGAIILGVKMINSEELTLTTDPTLTLGIPAKYWMDLRDYNPIDIAKNLEIPMIILQGGRDYQVPPTEFDLWKAGLGDQAEYRYYESLNHLFIAGEGKPSPEEYSVPGKVDNQVIEDLAEWIHSVI